MWSFISNTFYFIERGQSLDRSTMGMCHTVWIHALCIMRSSHHAASNCLGHCIKLVTKSIVSRKRYESYSTIQYNNISITTGAFRNMWLNPAALKANIIHHPIHIFWKRISLILHLLYTKKKKSKMINDYLQRNV